MGESRTAFLQEFDRQQAFRWIDQMCRSRPHWIRTLYPSTIRTMQTQISETETEGRTQLGVCSIAHLGIRQQVECRVAWTCKHGRSREQCAVVALLLKHLGGGAGGVGQLGMAHRSDGPASSLRMFGHVHWAMCGGGCQFEVLEEHACT